MNTDTLRLGPRDAAGLHPITALRQWASDLGNAWAALRRPVEPTLDDVSGLSARLLADIGAPEELRDRAALAEDRRHQQLLEMQQGHRAFFDGRW